MEFHATSYTAASVLLKYNSTQFVLYRNRTSAFRTVAACSCTNNFAVRKVAYAQYTTHSA